MVVLSVLVILSVLVVLAVVVLAVVVELLGERLLEGKSVGFLLIVVLWFLDAGDGMVCRHGAQSVGQTKTAGTPPWECPLHFYEISNYCSAI